MPLPRSLSRIVAAARRLAVGPDADGEEHFRMWLRCGACDVWREVCVSDAEAKDFELVLDRQTAQIARSFDGIDRDRMEAELNTFVAALDRDLIDATDFAR
jgi:hypothetical protein